LTGAGAEFYVPRYSGTTSLTPGLIYDNGVYVGINRTNPFYTLDVNGTLNVEGNSIFRTLTGSVDRLVYSTLGGQISAITLGTGLSLSGGVLTATGTGSGSIGGSGTSGYIPKFTATSSIGNSLIFDNGTYVGIGTTSPSSKLQIQGTGAGAWLTINRTDTGTNIVDFTQSGTRLGYLGYIGNDLLINNAATSNIQFNSAGIERMRITSAGNVGIGTTSLTNISLNVAKNITGGTNANAIQSAGTVQSDVTVSSNYFVTAGSTQATAFTLTNLRHFTATQGTIGAGSTVTNQYGFFVDSSLVGATNDYGFFGNIPSGANRWNLYMGGTADNYLAGNLGVGTTPSAWSGYTALQNTGGSLIGANGELQLWQNAFYNGTSSIYVATGTATRYSMTGGQYRWFNAPSGTAGNAITWTQAMTLDASGSLGIGPTTINASAKLQVDSTTQGVLFPRMTTTQKNAIASPAVGLIIYDTTLNKLCVYTGAWQTITSA
jgi:hypothetical protein